MSIIHFWESKRLERKIVINVFLFTVTPRLFALVNLLLMPLISGYLTQKDFGVWGIVTSYVEIATVIAALGLEVNFTNSYFVFGENRFHLAWRKLSGILHISNIVGSILLSILLYLVIPDIHYKFFFVIIVVLPVILNNISNIASKLYIFREEPIPVSIRKLAGGFFSSVIIYVCVVYFKLGFWGWALGATGNAIVIYLTYFKFFYIDETIIPDFSLPKKRTLKYLKISLPIIPHWIAFVLLSSSDRMVMQWYHIDLNKIGLYSLGYSMAGYMFLFINGFLTALGPRIQKNFRAGNYALLDKLIKSCHIVIISMIFLLGIWMKELFSLMIRNAELLPAYKLAVPAVFTTSFHIWYYLVSLPIFIREKTHLLPFVVFIPGVINIILNSVLIPVFGYKVALLTTLVCYMLTPLMGTLITPVRLLIIDIAPHFLRNVVLASILNILLLAISFWCVDFGVLNKSLISLTYSCFAGVGLIYYYKSLKYEL